MVRRYIVLIIIACFGISWNLQGQSWNTVGNGLHGFKQYSWLHSVSTEDANEVYVAIDYSSTGRDVIVVGKWNGLFWTYTPPVHSTSVHDIAVVNDTIYLASVDFASFSPLQMFDGTSWSSHKPPGFTGAILNVENCGGKLYCTGGFNATSGIQHIMSFDGASFSSLPPLPWLESVEDVTMFNGELYIVGLRLWPAYSTIDSAVMKLNSLNMWERAFQHYSGTTLSPNNGFMINYNNNLHLIAGENKLHIIQNDTLQLLGNAPQANVLGAQVLNGDLFLADYYSVSGSEISKYNSGIFTPFLNTPARLTGISGFNNELYAFSYSDRIYNGILYNGAFRTSGLFSSLNGTLYKDSITNCLLDASEKGLPDLLIGINNNLYQLSTNTSGQYSIGLPPGAYTVDTVYSVGPATKNFIPSCGLPNQVNLLANQTLTQNIAFGNSVPVDFVLQASSFTGFRARHGFICNYKVDVINAGNSSVNNTTLNVEIPNTFLFQSSTPVSNAQNGNLLSYQLPPIKPFESISVYINALVDTAQNQIDDQVVFSTWLDSIPSEADYGDNYDSLHQIISAAFDPNDKHPSSFVISPSKKSIDYHIRFQNTGNDTAFRVVVVDSIEASFPLERIFVNAASHSYKFSQNGNFLVWEFDNIMLPDSSIDNEKSQGFINFTAYIDANNSVGDTLTNDADIYFDFQKPIHTNVAKTAVVLNFSIPEVRTVSPDLKIYPNPTKDILIIQNESNIEQHIKITDLNGKLMAEKVLDKTFKWIYSVQNLAAGLYIISTPKQRYKIVVLD